MRKFKEALHIGHQNVPPSAAQASSAPAPLTGTAQSTIPGTGLGVQQPLGAGAYQQPLGTTLGAPGYGAAPLGGGLAQTTTTTVQQQPYLSSVSTATPGMATGLAAPAGLQQQQLGQTLLEKETRIVEEERVVQPGWTETTTLAPATTTWTETTPTTRMEAPVIEHKEKAAVVQEIIKPGTREEIQPVIHRDREQLEIHEEILPIYEKAVQPTIVEDRQLAPEIRPDVRLGTMPVMQAGPIGSIVTEREHLETITKPAIVEEVVHKKIIEEVQPVIHRETIAPKIIREVKPIYEKVIEAPIVTYDTLPARYAAAPAPPQLAEETIVTTTRVEKEFVPGTTSSLTSGRAATLGAPTTTSTLQQPTTTTTTSYQQPGFAGQQAGFAQQQAGFTQQQAGFAQQQAPVTEFREMKLEERTVTPGGPSTFQRY